MYCRNCGKEIDEKAVVCPHCGVAQVAVSNTPAGIEDNGGLGWGLLGCCIPLVGLILFLVWKDNKPKTSKAAGIGAIVGVVAIVALYVFLFLFAFSIARTGEYYYY